MRPSVIREQLALTVRLRVYERDDYRCLYCGVETSEDRQDALLGPSVDHILPVSRGGCHCLSNLATACRSCNSRKATKTLDEYRAYLAYHTRGLGKARDLLFEALSTCSTPFDEQILNAANWLDSQIPDIEFWGDTLIAGRLSSHERDCIRAQTIT